MCRYSTLNTGDEEVTDRKEEGSEEKGKDGDQDMDPKPVSLAKLVCTSVQLI